MKKYILPFVLLLMISSPGFSQKLNDDDMVFFGLDFSKAKMVGADFKDPANIRLTLFSAWNGFFRTEESKYNVGDAFKKRVTYDFDNVDRNNKAVSVDKLVTLNDYAITAAQAESVVKGYDTKGKKGLGCVFVVESFDKPKVQGSIYVVFFDMASKKIILDKKLEGAPGGFGLKNYWAAAIRNVILEGKKQYPQWVKGW